MSTPASAEDAALLARMRKHMEAVQTTRASLQSLQGAWDSLSMLSHLSGTGIDIGGVRSAFAALTDPLLDQLGAATLRRCADGLAARAQVAIDILVRNLFERTADIGFLAMDDDLRAFANAAPATRAATQSVLQARLREYQRKYTVYEDIVLLAPNGDVLARLDDSAGTQRSHDPLVAEALTTGAAYVEAWRESDLRPGRRSLIYAFRMLAPDGRGTVGVLALCFRLEDECERIFSSLSGPDDWRVLGLLTAQGQVVSSSDALLLAPGLTLPGVQPGAGVALVRYAGRRWLSVTCAASPYQGYAGPGWTGHAMIPFEQGFEDTHDAGPADPDIDAGFDPRLRAAAFGSPRLFSDALRDIPRIAADIETRLARTVWNGSVALAAASTTARDGEFSKILLREIGATGTKTREVFTQAIAGLNRTVLTASIDDLRARAALAVDIMDRNLYERACDCRWWALTTGFRHQLAHATPDADALGRALREIHALYTVYANLVLFDRDGRIVAASIEQGASARGQRLDQEWVARALALSDTQGYVVSDFAPTALYGDRPTYIYAAAVRTPSPPDRVVGGIAIVFDSEPQFRAMLADTLQSGEAGAPRAQATGVFADARGRIVASNCIDLPLGASLPASLADGSAGALVQFGGGICAVGMARSPGYREFKGPLDTYRNDIRAVALLRIAEASAIEALTPDMPPPMIQPTPARRGEACVDLATFQVGDSIYALPSADIEEALGDCRILPLAGSGPCVLGTVRVGERMVCVLDARALLAEGTANTHAGDTRRTRELVLLRAGAQGQGFAICVDRLGTNMEVPRSHIVKLGHGVIDEIVQSPDTALAAGQMLLILSSQRLAAAVGTGGGIGSARIPA